MAWVFVRLKARLIVNGLRGGTGRAIATVVGALYGAVLAVGGFAVLAAAGSRRTDGPDIAMLFGAALTIGWVTFPLLGFGSDETLDPTRLELLPLSRYDQITGLLAASLVGIGPLATLVALAGGVAGFARVGPAAALVVAAAAVQLVFCLSLSRAVVTALSAALRSRRGRDLRVILVALVALLPQLLRFAFIPGHASLRTLRPLANVAGWLPLALPMRAMVAAGRGRVAVAAGELALAVAATVAVLWWWSNSLRRIATAPEAPASAKAASPKAASLKAAPPNAASSKPAPKAGPPGPGRGQAGRPGPTANGAGPAERDPLFGAGLAWLPRTRMGAVAARETLVTWRDPRRRVQLVSTILLPFFVLAGVLARGVSHRPALVYGSLLVIALGGARANNQLGLDGRAWWVHEASGADPANDLRGKNLSLVVTSLPIAVVTSLILAGLSGGWPQLLPVVLFAAALCGLQLAVGNIVSLRAPWPVPTSRSNAWAANTGQGCFTGLIGILALFAVGVLCIPAIIAVVLVPSAVGRTVIALAALLYGYGMWRLGTAIAVRDGTRRGPEILAALSRGSGAT